MMGGMGGPMQSAGGFGAPDASVFRTAMNSGPQGGNFAGPGAKFQSTLYGNPMQSPDKPKVVEDPRQKEFGDVFSIAKTKLKDRVQHAPNKVDEFVTNYRQSNSDLQNSQSHSVP